MLLKLWDIHCMTYSLFFLFSNSLDGFVTLNYARFETKDMLNTLME